MDKKKADHTADPQLLPKTSSHLSTLDDDSRTLIMEVQKNLRERVRIGLNRYRGHDYVEMRVWYVDAAGEFQPSRQGILLKPSLIPQVIQALQLAARAVDPQGAR